MRNCMHTAEQKYGGSAVKQILLKDGTALPCVGQGTWFVGEHDSKRASEIEALRWGIEHDMTLIDTAEMYGEGASEELVGEAIAPYEREKLFLVSKVYPWNAGRAHIFDSCEQSLKRLGTSYLDLYLLHWRGSVPLAETVSCMEELVRNGMIRRWGVSNFDTDDMEELYGVKHGDRCQTDQVLYHLGSRGTELELQPWLKEHDTPLMAYCPLGQGGTLRSGMTSHPVLKQIAEDHQVSVFQVLLAFVLRSGTVFAIPKAGTASHVQANREAADLVLSLQEIASLEQAFPTPKHPVRLDMV